MSIAVYNSFHKIWKVQENKTGTGFTINNEGRRGEHISMLVSELVEDKLDKSVLDNTGSLWTLYKGAVRVHYDDASFAPVAASSRVKSDGDAIIAYALSIKPGYKLTSFYNAAARIHAIALDENSYVDFIANMSCRRNVSPHISITLVNEKEGKVIAISINTGRDGKIKVSEKVMAASEIPAKGEKGHINTTDFVARARENGRDVVTAFYPSSPTHLIVTKTGNKEAIEKAIAGQKNWREPKRFDIREVDSEESLRELANSYKAVTLGYDCDMSYEFGDIKNDNMADTAKELFDTVYLLGLNGFIYKAKIGGKLKMAPVKK